MTGRIEIREPFAFEQKGLTFFSFVLSAAELLKFGRVERFEEVEEGVQRASHDKHVEGIVASMRRPDVLFVESFVVYLGGAEWTYRKGVLVGKVGSYLSIENGQHRLKALDYLTPEELEQFEFPVTAMPLELSYEQRLLTFLQQGWNKPIDARLQLAQQHVIDEWESPQHEAAYEICRALNSDDDSPLKDRLIMLDSSERPYERDGRATMGINVKGIYNALVRVLGPNSTLARLTIDEQVKVIKNFLRLIIEVWPRAWESSQHILSTSRGIHALLLLFQTSPEFKAAVRTDLREDNLRRVLMQLKPYAWTAERHKNFTPSMIAGRLDAVLARAAHKSGTPIQVD